MTYATLKYKIWIIDPTLLPLEDLPIQEHLRFEPCEKRLQQAYLRSLALAQGHLIPQSDVDALLDSDLSEPDGSRTASQHPNIQIERQAPNLRQTINYLQLWCCGGLDARDAIRGGREVETDHPDAEDWFTNYPSTSEDTERIERLRHLVELHDLYQLAKFADNIALVNSDLASRPGLEMEVSLVAVE